MLPGWWMVKSFQILLICDIVLPFYRQRYPNIPMVDQSAPLKYRILDSFYRHAAQNPFLARLVVSLNFHSNKIFGYIVTDSQSDGLNSEETLIQTLGDSLEYFIDVGANRGQWASNLIKNHRENAQGLLYEPSPSVYEKLLKNVANCKGFNCKNIALGDVEGEMTFYQSGPASVYNSLVVGVTPNSTGIGVQVSTLDAECEREGMERVDLLKIDAEGYDLNVLKGARKLLEEQRIGVTQFEYSRGWRNNYATLKEAVEYLEALSYKVFLLKGNGIYKLQYDWYREYYSYSNFVGISPKFDWVIEKLYKGKI